MWASSRVLAGHYLANQKFMAMACNSCQNEKRLHCVYIFILLYYFILFYFIQG